MDQVKTEFLETQKHKPLVWCNETELKPYAFAFQEIQSQLGPWIMSLIMSSFFRLMVKKSSAYFWKIWTSFTLTSNFLMRKIRKHYFLDLNVSLLDGNISTDWYVKPTDRHQFLHYASSHSDHTKCSIVFSQVLRVSRICSEKTDFLKYFEKMVFGRKIGY